MAGDRNFKFGKHIDHQEY